MKEIKLTKGKTAFVDDEDFEFLNQYSWRALKSRGYKQETFVAISTIKQPDGTWKTVYMHRLIMNAPEGLEVDHKNRLQTLNNQKSNLRLCTRKQNGQNRSTHKNNTSGFKGVLFIKRTGKFIAQITIDGKLRQLGTTKTAEAAAELYKQAAARYFGEYASDSQ